MSEVRVLAFNVRKEDEPLEGPGRAWGPIAALVNSHHPHVVLLQELDGSSGKPRAPNGRPQPGAAVDTRQAERLGRALGMRIRVADAPTSTVHTAIAWQPDLELAHWEELTDPVFHHGQSLAVLHHPAWTQAVTCASVHMSPFSARRAAEEGRHLIEPLLRHSPLVVAGGDFNTAAVTDEVDWAGLPAHNRSARLVADGGPPRPNLELEHLMDLAGLADPAVHLAQQRQDPTLLQATGTGRLRVDRFGLTRPLLPLVHDYRHVDNAGLSDHVPILLTLDIPTHATRDRDLPTSTHQ